MPKIASICLILSLLAPFATLADTYDADPRCRGEGSTYAQGMCLEKQLAVYEKDLDNKFATLVQRIAAWRPGINATEAEREIVLLAINNAHQAWKKLVDIECRQLAGSQNWGGTIAENNELNCRIERTQNRIQFITKNRAYSYFYADR